MEQRPRRRRRRRDGPLLACVLSYLSYLAESQDDPEEALRLLTQVYADLATAAVQACDFEQANTLVAQSLDTVLRTETTLAKQRLQSLTRRLPKAADKNIRELRERLAAIT